jgi:FeS assembly SUF system protein
MPEQTSSTSAGPTPAGTPFNVSEIVALHDKIVERLRTVYDPEIPVNIYDLGLIYEVKVEPTGEVYVRMTLTSPGCPAAGTLPGEVEDKVVVVPGVKNAKVDVVWDPTWDKEMMSEAAKLQLGFM